MRIAFVESSSFTKRAVRMIDDRILAEVHLLLIAARDIGRVMPGCGGLRKLRIGDPQRKKGKRGGHRIIYLHVPEIARIYLLDIYDKSQKNDLSADEKKQLRAIVRQIRTEVSELQSRQKEELS